MYFVDGTVMLDRYNPKQVLVFLFVLAAGSRRWTSPAMTFRTSGSESIIE